MTKLWPVSVSFIFVLPAFACLALLAQTTPPSLPSDPTPQQNQPQQSNQSQRPSAPPQAQKSGQETLPGLGTIQGTVTDVNGNPVTGAIVGLRGSGPNDVSTVTTNDSGFFEILNVEPGVPYHVNISADGFTTSESPVVILEPGQRETLEVSKLRIEELQTTITVTPESSDEIAVEEVKIEEKQRGLGIVPNFFEAYGPTPAPLTARLKFRLTLRVVRDPFTAVGVTILAGAGQARGSSPTYVQGIEGYGERFGANYANQFTDLMIGGAILPSLLHQDPRYFYQGTGTKKSRALHAIASLVIAKGDNGRWQPNYSSFGGDLASAAISNVYYPASNRGVGLVFQNFAIDTAVHAGVRLLQEFAFRPTKGTTVR